MVVALVAAFALLNAPPSLERGITIDVTSAGDAMKATDFEQLYSLGFRTVRLKFAVSEIAKPSVTEELMETARAATRASLTVMLSEIKPEGSDDDARALWARLANVMGRLGEREVAFAPAPRATIDWVKELRPGLPRHTIVIEFPTSEDLMASPPTQDSNVVLAFRFDEPLAFTHQGIESKNPLTKFLKNLPYPSTPRVVSPLLFDVANIDARKLLKSFGDERWNAETLDRRFRTVARWASERRARVMCSWVGASRTFAEPGARNAYLGDTVQALQKNEIPWMLGGYTGPFGIFTGEAGLRVPDWSVLNLLRKQ
ncbi:MAG: hypothetical protein ACOYON_00575 [Fimbriimonas sp.]